MDGDWAPVRDALPLKRPPCHFFLAGICRNGTTCRFSHDQPTGELPAVPARNARNATAKPACKFYARGLCQKGASCSFTHDPNIKASKPAPCRFFAQGSCLAGDSCPFAHDPATVPAPARDGSGIQRDDDSTDNFVRPIAGGEVYYGDGATIEKISLDADFSSVRLINLPANSTKQSILDLIASVGISIPGNSIRVFSNKCIADLRVEDPKFADKISSRLLPTLKGDVQVAHYATRLSKPTLASGGRHSTTKKVHVTWFRPTRTVWLKFQDENLAMATKAFFDSGEYKVVNLEIQASHPSFSRGPDRALWTVELTSVPAEVTETMVRSCFQQEHQPKYVMLGPPSYVATNDDACAAVRTMLAEVGPLAWFETNANIARNSKRIRAVACFLSETDAREAASVLNNSEAPFSANVKLAVDLAHSIKFKFQARIYEAVASEIGALVSRSKAAHYVHIYEYPDEDDYKAIKVESREYRHVANAVEELESIISGIVATDGKDAIWSPLLFSKGDLWRKVKTIGQTSGVIIWRDKMRSQLRVIGPKLEQAKVVRQLADIIKQYPSASFNIDLTPEQYEWARTGGFKAISTKLGRNIARFDIISEPKKIVITGSELHHMKAKVIILEAETGDANLGAGPSDSDCSICWCDAEDPVLTACGHKYCAECFDNLAQSQASSSSRVECKGASDTCKALIPLNELQALLSSSSFERVLAQSFQSFVDSHPLEYRCCSTPDCPQIFRAAGSGAHNCTECLATTCKKCGDIHDGMKCGEKTDANSEEQQQLRKLKWELGIKDCPKCKTPIEKTEGCNHMTCAACKAHICWVCLRFFPTSTGCYEHLNSTHGGIYV